MSNAVNNCQQHWQFVTFSFFFLFWVWRSSRAARGLFLCVPPSTQRKRPAECTIAAHKYWRWMWCYPVLLFCFSKTCQHLQTPKSHSRSFPESSTYPLVCWKNTCLYCRWMLL